VARASLSLCPSPKRVCPILAAKPVFGSLGFAARVGFDTASFNSLRSRYTVRARPISDRHSQAPAGRSSACPERLSAAKESNGHLCLRFRPMFGSVFQPAEAKACHWKETPSSEAPSSRRPSTSARIHQCVSRPEGPCVCICVEGVPVFPRHYQLRPRS
jgi:hypothetical protein